jgi:hypothetical protein
MSTFKSEDKKEWAQLIGQTLIDFGDIEMITYRCLERFPSENIFPSVSRMKLGQRIDLITNVIQSKFGDKANKMVSLLGRVKYLSKNRNLIAHNPMSWDIFEDEQGKITDFKQVIRSELDENKQLHFHNLEELAKEVAEIVPKLIDEYANLDNLDIFGNNA